MSLIEDFGKSTLRRLWNAVVATPVSFWQPTKYKLSPLLYRAHTEFVTNLYGLPSDPNDLLDGQKHGKADGYFKAIGIYPIVDVQLSGLLKSASSFTKPYEPKYTIRLGQDDVKNHFLGEKGSHDAVIEGRLSNLPIARDVSLEDAIKITNRWEYNRNLPQLLDSCMKAGQPNHQNIHYFREVIETTVPLKNGRVDFDMLSRHKMAIEGYNATQEGPSVWSL